MTFIRCAGAPRFPEDACDLTSTLEAKDFDVVFDKSTLDALKCRGPEATGRPLKWRDVWFGRI